MDRTWARARSEQWERLKTFRETHPSKCIDVDGRRWPYLSCGHGERTLLFLAGAFLRSDMWFHVIGELEHVFRILAPDTNMLAGLSARQALDALPRLMDAEGVTKASVIGLSAGGGMAQMFLQEHPERTEDVVLSHTGILEHRPELEAYTRRLIRLVKLAPMGIVRRTILKKTGGVLPAGSAWRDFHDAYFQEAGSRITRRVVLDFLRNGVALRRESVFRPEALERWNGRMLILGSRDDTVTLPALEKLKARYPAARVQLLDEGGHHTFLLYPETYTQALKGFLSA